MKICVFNIVTMGVNVRNNYVDKLDDVDQQDDEDKQQEAGTIDNTCESLMAASASDTNDKADKDASNEVFVVKFAIDDEDDESICDKLSKDGKLSDEQHLTDTSRLLRPRDATDADAASQGHLLISLC